MARLRDRLLAHGSLVDDLRSTLDEGAAATFLFAGPAGVGKKFAAMCLAQSLLCETSAEGCGHCGSCLRVESGAHESLRLVSPEGAQIKTDQAREIVEFLQLRTWGKFRIIIFDGAQALNPQAANSLLKALEEPPPGTIFILLAPSPSAVLPTLRSRARAVLFRPLREEEMTRLLAAPSWALRAARGSLERLNKLLDPAETEARLEAAAVLTALIETPTFLLENFWREALKEKGKLHGWIPLWMSLLRDAWAIQAGGEKHIINTDLRRQLEGVAKASRSTMERLLIDLQNLEQELRFNRDPQLAIEQLWSKVHHP